MIQTSIIKRKYYHIRDIDETEYSEKVWAKKEKLEKYELLKAEGCEESTIFTVLEVKRSTFYRWKKNYKEHGLFGLEDQDKRPHNTRKPSWEQNGVERKIYHLRMKYKLWGKAKIAVIYQREYGEKIGVSTVGRILEKLMNRGKIKPVALLAGRKITRQRLFNGHAQRIPKNMKPAMAGDLIQIDHMTLQVPRIGYIKQFSAICPTTKIAVERIYKEATSANAADFLNQVRGELPFTIRSIQVDGGSEFMKDFEVLCQELTIPLYVLPPNSPEQNGVVERGNGTFKYEFYSQYSGVPNFHSFQKSLQKFVGFYNKIRPHQGLNYLTPYQFYESINKGTQSHMS